MERTAIVDEQDRFLRWEPERAIVHAQQLVHRSVHVLLLDSAERFLIQRRHQDKLTHGGYWDLSCTGHVEEEDYQGGGPDADLDAVYLRAAWRELAEELGVQAEPVFVGHFGPEPGVHYEQLHLYRARSDGPYVLQEEEVIEIRLVGPDELRALLDDPAALSTPTLRHFSEHVWRGAS